MIALVNRQLVFLFFVVLLILILRFSGLAVEQTQFLFFPIVVLLFSFYNRDGRFKIPNVVFSLSLVFGAFSSLKIRGFLTPVFYRHNVFVSSPNEPEQNYLTRKLYNEFNEISTKYDFPRMSLLFKDFVDVADVRSWLGNFSKPVFLLRVDDKKDWQVNFGKNIFAYPEINIEDKKQLQMEAYKYGIDLEDNVIIVKQRGLNFPLLFITAPEVLNLQDEDTEVLSTYLSWLGFALTSNDSSKESADAANTYALRENSLGLISQTRAEWKSPKAIALAKMFLGVNYFVQYIDTQDLADQSLGLATESFFGTVKYLRIDQNPELISLARNNYAVSLFLAANSRDDLADAIREFKKAVNSGNSENLIPRGAKIALFNLLQLEKNNFGLD